MQKTQTIKLPEHNSSRLLFFDNPNSLQLYIEDTTSTNGEYSSYCTEANQNKWLLGKFTDYIWFLEDICIYDSNHTHTANIYYIDPNTNEKEVIFNVIRTMEYGSECDRLYCENGGSLKLKLIGPNESQNTSKFYIKNEKYLPGPKEEIADIQDPNNNNQLVKAILFYKYSNGQLGIVDVGVISNILSVSIEYDDNSVVSMSNINYIQNVIDYNNTSIDFNKIEIRHNIPTNNTNDIKIGILGIRTTNKKFLSTRIQDACIEPSYFIVQVPSNLSWICYRTYYSTNSLNNPGEVLTFSQNMTYMRINEENTELNGYYQQGTNYVNIDPNILGNNIINHIFYWHILIPCKFFEYMSDFKYDNETFDKNNDFNKIYNELDGLEYMTLKVQIDDRNINQFSYKIIGL